MADDEAQVALDSTWSFLEQMHHYVWTYSHAIENLQLVMQSSSEHYNHVSRLAAVSVHSKQKNYLHENSSVTLSEYISIYFKCHNPNRRLKTKKI